jgi:hypothetical protein
MSTAAGISPDFLEISLSRYETGEIEVAPEILKQAAWRYHAGTPLDRVANGLHAGEIAVVLDELFEHK